MVKAKPANDTGPVVWVLADDKAGHKNQALGVAEALGWPYEIKKITYNKNADRPNLFLGASLKGIDRENSDPVSPPFPDIVISAGRKTVPIAKYIKKQAKAEGKRCYLAHIMWPDAPAGGFDLIAVPAHDGKRSGKKVITTTGAPHRVNAKMLEREGMIWQKTLSGQPKPYIALLVGGNTGKTSFTTEHAKELGKFASNMTASLDGSLMVTTSRRTGEDVRAALQDIIECPAHFHNPEEQRANPYYAFLALSNAVIVTGDSISMISEACATGKPVYIFAPDEITPKKHRKFHKILYEGGYASSLTGGGLNIFVPGQIKPLNDAQDIADRIRREESALDS